MSVNPEYPTLTQVAPRQWRVEAPVSARFKGFPSVKVPVGEITDGASVPRAFWPICPPMSNYTNAAVVHDYLYKHQPPEWERVGADQIFLACMEYLGVSRWRRSLMFRMVRMFGPRWKRHDA